MLFASPAGWAHPHVWVNTDLTLIIEDGAFTGLRVKWVFDPLYSVSFMQEVDTNGNQRLEDAEVAPIIKATFETDLAALKPFFLLAFNRPDTSLKDDPYAHVPAADFTIPQADIWYTPADEALHYAFTLKFTTPHPISGQHKVAVYDPSYYIAFEQALDISYTKPTTCQEKLTEDKSLTIYQGLVNPETYKITCKPT